MKKGRKKHAVVIGGEFSTQWNVGLRRDMLREFSHMFGCCVANLRQLPIQRASNDRSISSGSAPHYVLEPLEQ